MKVAVVGKDSGMLEDMLKALPWFVQFQPAVELFSPSRTIVHTATTTRDTMWLMSPIGVYPDKFFTRFNDDISRQKKRCRSKHHHNGAKRGW
jgi:hypothetical protein